MRNLTILWLFSPRQIWGKNFHHFPRQILKFWSENSDLDLVLVVWRVNQRRGLLNYSGVNSKIDSQSQKLVLFHIVRYYTAVHNKPIFLFGAIPVKRWVMSFVLEFSIRILAIFTALMTSVESCNFWGQGLQVKTMMVGLPFKVLIAKSVAITQYDFSR